MYIVKDEDRWRIHDLEERGGRKASGRVWDALAVWVAQRQRIEDPDLCVAWEDA